MTRRIDLNLVKEEIFKLFQEANIFLDKELKDELNSAKKKETEHIPNFVLETIIENYKIAEKFKKPLCQDTGTALIFLEIGQDIQFFNGNLTESINEAVEKSYKEGFLRKSIVEDPIFGRKNTKTNTPAIIYQEIVKGSELKITVAPKGGGAENMSRIKMLKPSEGLNGLEEFVLETIKIADGNPCPPIIVGIGVGGNFDRSAFLAKKSLLRDFNSNHKDKNWLKVENNLLQKINNLNIGPQGLGGKTTALKVFIEVEPCHIASLPIAVNIQCHSHRHKSIIL